jgi:hypothetical protein
MPNKMITLAAAAGRLQSTPLNVLMHIKRGLLAGEEVEGCWWVESASFERLLQNRGTEPKVNLCQSNCTHNCPSCE